MACAAEAALRVAGRTEWGWAGCAFPPVVQVLTAGCPSTAVMGLFPFPCGKCHTL